MFEIIQSVRREGLAVEQLLGDGRPGQSDEVAADGMNPLGLQRQKGPAGSV